MYVLCHRVTLIPWLPYEATPLVPSVAGNTQANDTLPSIGARGGANCRITPRPHTSPFRFGHCSASLLRALLEPRWWPCQIQIFSQKPTGGAPGWGGGGGGQVGRCPPKIAHFVPQNSLLWPKTARKPTQNGPNEGKWLVHSTCAFTSSCQESFLAL